MPGVVLASASPRRAELLDSADLDFEVRPADIDESVRPGESPQAYVRRLSIEKAAAVARPGEIVIAADTTVEIDGEILGKPDRRRRRPADDRPARRVGPPRPHRRVGARRRPDPHRRRHDDRRVRRRSTRTPSSAYIATGEPFDKAGGYAIQGAGGALVRRIDGSVSNVIGLPLDETLELLSWATDDTR